VPVALILVGYFLQPHEDSAHALSSYECGFIPMEGQSSKPLLAPFFIVGLIFLLFDLELL
jgi:NADH:ubiquinone oxidoreductase subunit 3 (subunit A)